jgi:hypothetical protein
MAVLLTQCTIEELRHILTEYGVVRTTLEDLGPGDAIQGVLDMAEERAETKILLFIADLYELAENTTSNWLKWCKAVFWAVALCRRFGVENDALRLEYEEFLEALIMIRDGSVAVPDGIPRRSVGGVSASNLEFDRRFRTSRVRVVTPLSAGDQKSDVQRKSSSLIDYDL